MQPACAFKALNKDTIMGSKTVGLPGAIVGPKGLRAGWRLLIFLVMLVAMGAVARAIIIRILIPAGFSPDKFTRRVLRCRMLSSLSSSRCPPGL
jgi:hypothetical protein